MIDAIRVQAQEREIRRLCHFTPSKNFGQIVSDSYAIRPTQELAGDVRAVFTPTDLLRLDGYRDHVCCSIQYPNTWYLETARKRQEFRSFPDWVVLVFSARYLWRLKTKFCPENAAGASPGAVREGAVAFTELFANPVTDHKNRTWMRRSTHLSSCPTNLQAEVLVPGSIPLDDVTNVTVRDEEQAKLEYSRLAFLSGVRPVPIVICPAFFNKDDLRVAIWSGTPPDEILWTPQ